MTRLKPLNDIIFKKLFGENQDKDLLIGFLNAVLENDVEDLYIVEEKLNKEKIDDKQGILDIKAICYTGEKINIEVQLANEYNMKERTLFYWSKLFTENFKAAEKYSDLNKTITINILGFNYLTDIKSYHSSYKIYEDKSKQLLTDLLEIHFIEMPKFNETNVDLHNPLHRWLLFLRGDTVKQPNLEEVFILDQLVAKAEDKLRRLSADEETIRMYQLREKFIADQKTQIDGAKNEKATEIAKSLLKIPSMSVQDVANHTGLPVQKVKDIEREVR